MSAGGLRLVRHEEVTEEAYLDYMAEWEATGERVVPGATRREGRSFAEMARKWVDEETKGNPALGHVTGTLYFLVESDGRILGAIHQRHSLTERLLANGGNIGYGVRPSERRRGYGALMLGLLLDLLGRSGTGRQLVTCDEDNPASALTIEKCGGILWDKPVFEGTPTRRYWMEPGRRETG